MYAIVNRRRMNEAHAEETRERATRSRDMRSPIALLCGLLVLLLGVVSVRAQDASPTSTPNVNVIVGQLSPIGQPFEFGPGLTVEFLNEGPITQAPGQNAVLYRVTFQGGEILAHTHPGTTVLTVESGSLVWTLQKGTVQVTRPGAALEQVTESGTEIVLNAGDGLAYNADVVHTARGATDELTEVLIASVWEVGQPGVTVTDEQGTPAAPPA